MLDIKPYNSHLIHLPVRPAPLQRCTVNLVIICIGNLENPSTIFHGQTYYPSSSLSSSKYTSFWTSSQTSKFFITGTCCPLAIQGFQTAEASLRPQSFSTSLSNTSNLSRLSPCFLCNTSPTYFKYLCLLPHWKSWGLWEWHCQHSITHLHTPSSPPFLWSADISLSFFAKAIHSYLPKLHSTYFNLLLSFVFFFFPYQSSSCPINKTKNVPPYRKVLQEPCASLRLILICSLSCSHPQSLFLSSYLILFTAWLQFSPSGINVLISNSPLLGHPSETFHSSSGLTLYIHLTQFITFSFLKLLFLLML